MGIVVTSLAINNSDFNLAAPSTRHLWGNVFYKMFIQINFEVHTYAIATADKRILFAPTGYPDTTYIVDENGGGFFREFKSGDTLLIQSSTSNNGTFANIIKIDDNTIRTNSAMTVENSTTAQIYLAKTYSAVDYQYNFVENNEQPSFASKIDGSTQKEIATNIGAMLQTMIPQGYQSWHLGQTQIIRSAVTATYKNVFQIIQTVYITPFFLKEYELGTYPDYFLNANCLRFIFQLDVKPSATDNTRVQTLLFDEEQGNTGWLNENYNTGLTKYQIKNLTYTRVSDLTPLDTLQLSATEVTEVEFDIENTIDAPFSTSPANILVLNYINVPFEDSEYKQTADDLSYNFSFDRKRTTVGAVASNGDTGRAITNYEVTFVNSTKVHVKFRIDHDTTTYNRIAAMDVQKYLLAISVQDAVTSPDTSDGVTLAIDYNDYYIDLGLDAAVTVEEEKFIEHPYQDKADGVITLESFTEDEIVGYKRFKINTSLAQQPFTISEIRAGIKASNGTDTFKLSEYSLPIQNVPIVNGIEYINEEQAIPFKAPNTELVTKFSVLRDIAADANPIYYFDVYFGWLNRWEYWLENGNINTDFFDTGEPMNGLNNKWERFDTLGYSLYYFVEWDLTVNGLTQTLTFDRSFTVADYNSNADWANEDIKTYDSNNNLLTNGGVQYILGYEDTKVVCEFEWVGAGAAPLTSEVDIIMRLEGYEIGGQFGSTRISSARNVGNESQWVSIDLSNKVVKTSAGNVIYGTAKIDNFTLQAFEQFSITARIYDKRADENCLLQEDGAEIFMENGDCILLEG